MQVSGKNANSCSRPDVRAGLGNAKAVQLWSLLGLFMGKGFPQSIFLQRWRNCVFILTPSGSLGRCWGRGRNGNGRFALYFSENVHQLNPKYSSVCLK